MIVWSAGHGLSEVGKPGPRHDPNTTTACSLFEEILLRSHSMLQHRWMSWERNVEKNEEKKSELSLVSHHLTDYFLTAAVDWEHLFHPLILTQRRK